MYVTWLNNAYALEQDLIKKQEAQINDFNGFPEAQEELKKHIEETKSHAETLKECIEQNGGSVSAVKSFLGGLSGTMSGLGMETMHDKVVKNALLGYSVENFEIAGYVSLIAAAKEVGDEASVPKLEGILAQEEAMAKWYKDNLEKITVEFLQREHEE